MRRAVTLAVLTLSAAPLLAQAPDGRGEATLTLSGKKATIEYGRPSLRGRDMLGQAKVGDQWRLGSNDPTRLTTEGALTFGAAVVPPGSYILKATRTSPEAWTLNVMNGGDTLVDVPLASGALSESVETFTIKLTADAQDKSAGLLELLWGKTALRAPFKVK
jgi:hypothetical protein